MQELAVLNAYAYQWNSTKCRKAQYAFGLGKKLKDGHYGDVAIDLFIVVFRLDALLSMQLQ